MTRLGVLVCALIFAASGCSSGAERSAPPPIEVELRGPARFVPVVAWSACSLDTEGGDTSAECANVKVPLDWSAPAGETISLFLKRVHAAVRRASTALLSNQASAAASDVGSAARHGQEQGEAASAVWLLGEGPGSSGVELEGLARDLLREDRALDVYLPDPRGTGRSTKLECPPEESLKSPGGMAITASEWKDCLTSLDRRWGPRLRSFSTSETARDFDALVAATARPGQSVFFYGRSYGSYLASRYVTVSARKPDGLILDSACAPGACFFSEKTSWYTRAGKEFLAACAADTLCESKLGKDPWTRVGQALDALEKGRCASLGAHGIDRATLRALFASYLTDRERRALIPALAYRILRCDRADLQALTKFATDLQGPARVPAADRYRSQVLAAHVTLSELSASPHATPVDDRAYFEPGDAIVFGSLADAWPRYVDPLAQSWPAADVPMLALVGALDPAASIDDPAVHRHLARARMITFPASTGGAALSSPTTDSAAPCGAVIMKSFLAAPSQSPDLSCASRLRAISFEGAPGLAEATFGTADLWEN